MKLKNKKVYAAVLACTMGFNLVGCDKSKHVTDDLSYMDVLSTNAENYDGSALSEGVTQVRDVQGEDFKLVIKYMSGEKNWHITSNKKLYMEIKTQGLADNLEVYIDNIHMDTSIVSTKEGFNGIMQDTMDDRIHNSIMLGFPISDEVSYFGINEIEGQNDQFIEGYVYGNQYYTSGDIKTERHDEVDYLEDGVWANRVDSVIDLLIVDKETGKVIRQVCVDSALLIEVDNLVTYKEGNTYTVYQYDRDGDKTKVKTYKGE